MPQLEKRVDSVLNPFFLTKGYDALSSGTRVEYIGPGEDVGTVDVVLASTPIGDEDGYYTVPESYLDHRRPRVITGVAPSKRDKKRAEKRLLYSLQHSNG